MKEDTFKGSVLYNEVINMDKEKLVRCISIFKGAIEHHKNLTYTDDNGNEYKGSKFWDDALEFVEGKIKRRRS